MSLDITLYAKKEIVPRSPNIIIEENGEKRRLTIDELRNHYPTAYLYDYELIEVFDANITHNLTEMADKAGIYEACWRPYQLHPEYVELNDNDLEYEFEQNHVMHAKDIIPILEKGYKDMLKRPEYYEKFDSPNGWGLYVNFLPWVKRYLDACKEYPEAEINTSR